MNLFFISDTHFGHKNILKHADRPFDSIEEHDEYLIDRWNLNVSPKDHVYHLGDFCFWNKKIDANKIASRLNGKKYLIVGNHDKNLPDKHFTILGTYFELNPKSFDKESNVPLLVLCHYPFLSWNKAFHGSYCLYGHVHGRYEIQDNDTLRMDVGVDSNDYAPISWDEIETIMDEKKVKIAKLRELHQQQENKYE